MKTVRSAWTAPGSSAALCGAWSANELNKRPEPQALLRFLIIVKMWCKPCITSVVPEEPPPHPRLVPDGAVEEVLWNGCERAQGSGASAQRGGQVRGERVSFVSQWNLKHRARCPLAPWKGTLKRASAAWKGGVHLAGCRAAWGSDSPNSPGC